MLKVIGILIILAGAGKGLYGWRLGRLQRQKHLEEFAFYLQRAEFALEKEQIPLVEFFNGYSGHDALLCQCLKELASALQENTYMEGQMAWQAVFQQHEAEWNLTAEEWECVLQSGRAFFGRNRQELRRLLGAYRQRMEQYYAKEKLEFADRQKVLVPVGMLGSVMLILLLL